MPHHLISDVHEWMNEMPTVYRPYLLSDEITVDILNRDSYRPYLLSGETTANGMLGDIEFQRFGGGGGHINCRHKCSLGDYLVIDIFLYLPSDFSINLLHLCNKFDSNRTATHGDIAIHTTSTSYMCFCFHLTPC